jgi:hypothetical protein
MSYSHPYQKEFQNISFGPESVFKTALAVASVSGWIGILMDEQEMPRGKPEQKVYYTSGHTDSDAALGSATAAGAKPITVTEQKRTHQGKLSWIAQNRQLFQEIFGKKYTTLDSPDTGYNTHTYILGTINARPLPSITLAAWNDKGGDGFTAGTDICTLFSGIKLGKTTFSANEGEELKIEASIYGCAEADQTAFPGAFAQITTKPYLFNQGALTIFGGTYTRIKSISVDIDHKIKEEWYGSVDPYDLIEQRVELKANVTLVLDNDDIYDFQLAKPTASTRFSFVFTRTASQDTLTLESEPSGTTSFAYPTFTIKDSGGEGESEVDVEILLTNLRCVVVDNIDTNHVY